MYDCLPSGEEPGLEPVELPLLFLLLSLLTDRLERSFFCMRWDTGGGCFLVSGKEAEGAGGCVNTCVVRWPLLRHGCRPLCSCLGSSSQGSPVGWGWTVHTRIKNSRENCFYELSIISELSARLMNWSIIQAHHCWDEFEYHLQCFWVLLKAGLSSLRLYIAVCYCFCGKPPGIAFLLALTLFSSTQVGSGSSKKVPCFVNLTELIWNIN